MKTRFRTARVLVALGVLAASVALANSGGAFGGAGAWGTLCALCPVGFSQIAAASKSVPWHLLPGVVALLVVVFLIGRVFCSWLCPSQLLKNVFGGHAPRGIRGRSGAPAKGGCNGCGAAKGDGLFSQGVVLAVLLAVSFAVGFPVFCLLCPIGLVFGTLWALNRMFLLLEPGWELIIFPLMLFLELFLFKRWCSAICPLGFFFGLMGRLRSRFGFGLRPVADAGRCISGEGCRTCGTVCAEDLSAACSPSREMLDGCSLCLDCKENCPTGAVKLAWKVPKATAAAAEAELAEEKG